MNQKTALAAPISAVTRAGKTSVLGAMAAFYGMDPDKFYETLTATVMPKGTSPEQIAGFMLVANKYTLDPFTKEIYAFPGQNNAVVPIVGIDGWMSLANRQPAFDGIEFEDHRDSEGKLESITAIVYRKDRTHPVKVTEYLSECKRNTAPWNTSPSRMLRHRAAAQGIRYAFGIGGIYIAADEAEAGDYEVVMPERNAELIGTTAEVTNTTTGEIASPADEAPAAAGPADPPAAEVKPEKPRKDPF